MIPESAYRYFRPLDLHFARAMERFAGGEEGHLFAAALLVSCRAGMGDACLDIGRAGGSPLSAYVDMDGEDCILPKAAAWITKLSASPVVGKPGQFRPLVLDGAGRLYLHRFWTYERTIAESVTALAAAAIDTVQEELLAADLARFFPGDEGINWQRLAAYTAATKRLCIVSGGPGTGKTTAVVKMLAIIIRQGLAQDAAPLVAMAAPTGKASKRLQEAAAAAMGALALENEILEHLPREVFTLHRLLGIAPGAARTTRGPENPLPHDIVVVDEGSMADMALVARLLRSLKAGARLILLGDRDQLASVEAGAVLGDLCDTGREHGRSEAFVKAAAALAGEKLPAGSKERPLADSLVILRKSYRFGPESGIGALAAAVRDGDAAAAMKILESEDFPDVTLKEISDNGKTGDPVRRHVVDVHQDLAAAAPERALALLGEGVLLCALRQGARGADGVNGRAARVLYEEGLVRGDTPWYAGRPVMVTRNDYAQKLYNGDTGVVLPDPESGETRVYFPSMEGPPRKFIPARLPLHESAYAVTVHKSQGSEFGIVSVLLPERPSPILTRELLYTAVTRARRSVTIWGSAEVLEQTIAARIERVSGLREALWG